MFFLLLLQSDKNSGCYGNLQFPLAIFAVSLKILRSFFFTEMFLE